MGGICGFFKMSGSSKSLLEDITVKMKHRAPDGIFIEYIVN